MVQAWVVVVGASQHHDADPVLVLQLVEHLPCAAADAGLVFFQGRESGLNGAVVFFLRQAQDWLKRLQHLMGKQFSLREIKYGVDVLHIMLGEDIVLFGESGLHRLRSRGHRGAGVGPEDRVQRFLVMLFLNQVVDVRDADFCREARIDCATAGSGAIQF